MNRLLIAITTGSILFVTSCKKEVTADPIMTESIPSKLEVSHANLLKDSVYLFSKEIYLWQEVIPAYETFNPKQYLGSTELLSGTAVMGAIRKLQPLDRFSFVTTRETSEGLQTGDSKDFGFFVKAASIDKTEPYDSLKWFVTYVYDKSSAGLAGISRGWYINKINNTAITYTQSSINLLNDIFFGNSTNASFEFVKTDGSTNTANLLKTSYVSNSVLHKSVINTGGKKTGYIVFNQFFGEPSRAELQNAFSYFNSQGVKELIVDLRYNPGGSTETQDVLANLIAPASASNKVMYKYIFNSSLQKGNFPLLKQKTGYGNHVFEAANNTQEFSNTGSLNLSRVFFIVTGSTASASELLINNLKPYMDVKIIGDTTYGKPVGFFPVNVFDYSIYPISFKTVNSAGNADYYAGFAPDKSAPDGVNKNWGDVTEPCLESALRFINTGSYRGTGTNERLYLKQLNAQQQFGPLNNQLEENKFSGMFIEKRK
jgi:C-terminal processing protease CtpA/Prc